MYEYSAVMDNRTTPLCEQLDGVRLPHDHHYWNMYYPPNHYNCRSVCISLYDEEDEVNPPDNLDFSQFTFNPGQLF